MVEILQKCLERVNSVWRESADNFWRSNRRTMLRGILRYIVITATLFYYSKNIASATIREPLLEAPSNRKQFETQDCQELVKNARSKSGAKASNRTRIGQAIRSTAGK